MLLQWQRDFELGHPTTDAEHREVVDLLNELYVCLDADTAPEAIDRALDSLVHLLDSHLHARDDAPVIHHARDLRRNWREAAATPKRDDLRALAHWWLEHVCSHAHEH